MSNKSKTDNYAYVVMKTIYRFDDNQPLPIGVYIDERAAEDFVKRAKVDIAKATHQVHHETFVVKKVKLYE